MSQIMNRPRAVTDYDMPAWLVTALGVGLGVIGLAHLLTHPEPLSIWILEGLLVSVPAAIIVYGGYWIATRPLDRADRWIAAGWTVSGTVIAVGLVAGYIFSEQLSGGLVTESGQLVLFGALGGSLIALLAVISTQHHYHVPDVAYLDEDLADADSIGASSRTTERREFFNIGSRFPSVDLLILAGRIYREEGLRLLAALSWLVLNHKLVDLGVLQQRSDHEQKRTDNDDRWEMITPNLADTDETALDIGCARGFFTAKLADEGLSVTGIDTDQERVETAKRTWGEKEGIEFIVQYLDPETVSDLPAVDVVLLLTFYQQWCSFFGRESAEEILRELATNSNKIFFEAPGQASPMFQFVGDRPIDDNESIVEYYSSLLLSIFDERVEINYLGETEDLSHATRTNPMFLIECQEYMS